MPRKLNMSPPLQSGVMGSNPMDPGKRPKHSVCNLQVQAECPVRQTEQEVDEI